uniref:Mitochondrial potassium channel ATP-binding subunit n=1 Tax=Steinernema glaseri TaxID=37863 RepID=A0A1I7YJ42_9BILA
MLLALIRSKLQLQLSPTLQSIAKSIPSRSLQWVRSPEKSGNVLRAFRLTGVSLSVSVPLLRFAHCQAQKHVTKRTDHLLSQYRAQSEYRLTFSEIWRLLWPYFPWFLAAVVSAILAAAVNIQLPIALGQLVNVIAGYLAKDCASNFSLVELKPVAFQLMGLYAVQAILTAAYITFLSVLGERMAQDLRMQLFDRLLHQDMSFYDSQRTGELNARLSSDVQEFKSCFKLTVSQGLRTFAQTGGCIGSLLMISPKMTLLTVTVLPVVIGFGALLGSLLRKLSKHAQSQNAVASAVSDEAFSNIRTVKAFAMEDAEHTLFSREVEKTRVLNERLGLYIGLFQGATNFFLNGVILSVLYGGTFLIVNNEMTPGGLMSFLVTAQTIQKSLSQLSVVFGHAVKGWTAGARVFEFINLVPDITNGGSHRIPFHSLWGEIRFNDVTFSYPTRPGHVVFDGLDIVFRPGCITALCGPSGGGKSTIAALIERFYEPTSGSITLDGRDLSTLDLQWLRRHTIGIISQEPVLFGTTIAENIRYGKINATDEEVREAAKLANADDFISNFPHGYNTVVGERGVTLSGGQKQRIAIARALLKNPPILILDEATSALDSESERVVKEALDNAMRGRTVIIIAHRLSTIRNADEIVIIEGRQVRERGTHSELMKRKGVYYGLVNSQSQL